MFKVSLEAVFKWWMTCGSIPLFLDWQYGQYHSLIVNRINLVPNILYMVGKSICRIVQDRKWVTSKWLYHKYTFLHHNIHLTFTQVTQLSVRNGYQSINKIPLWQQYNNCGTHCQRGATVWRSMVKVRLPWYQCNGVESCRIRVVCVEIVHQICHIHHFIEYWIVTSPSRRICFSRDANQLFVILFIDVRTSTMISTLHINWLTVNVPPRFEQSRDLSRISDIVWNAGYDHCYICGRPRLKRRGHTIVGRVSIAEEIVVRGTFTHLTNIHVTGIQIRSDMWTYMIDLIIYQNVSWVSYEFNVRNYREHRWRSHVASRSNWTERCLNYVNDTFPSMYRNSTLSADRMTLQSPNR